VKYNIGITNSIKYAQYFSAFNVPGHRVYYMSSIKISYFFYFIASAYANAAKTTSMHLHKSMFNTLCNWFLHFNLVTPGMSTNFRMWFNLSSKFLLNGLLYFAANSRGDSTLFD